MIDLTRDIHSLTEFKRDTARLVKLIKKTGQPLVLTVNGKAELVVHDAASYQRMLKQIDEAEAIEGIRRGLAEMKAGKGRPLAEFDAPMRKKYKIPRDG